MPWLFTTIPSWARASSRVSLEITSAHRAGDDALSGYLPQEFPLVLYEVRAHNLVPLSAKRAHINSKILLFVRRACNVVVRREHRQLPAVSENDA